MRWNARSGPTLTVTDDPERWQQAQRSSGQPVTPFQSFAWLSLAATMTGTTFVPLVVRDGRADVGTATWLERTRLGVATVNRVPFPYVGPVVPSGLLMATLDVLRRRSVIRRVVLQEHHLNPGRSLDSPQPPAHFTLRTDSTYVVDTTRPEAELFAGMERRARNKLRQNERLGIEISEPENPGPLLGRVVDAVFERQGYPSGYNSAFPPPPAALHQDGLDARWAVASRDGVQLGSLLTVASADSPCAVGWVGGVLPEHRSTGANVSLYWDAIKWTAGIGASSLDMVGVPGEGVGTYKRQFGGTIHEYPVLTSTVPGVTRLRELRPYPAAWRDRLLRRQPPAAVEGASPAESAAGTLPPGSGQEAGGAGSTSSAPPSDTSRSGASA